MWGEGSAGVQILVDGMKRARGSLKGREVRGWSKAVGHLGGVWTTPERLEGQRGHN